MKFDRWALVLIVIIIFCLWLLNESVQRDVKKSRDALQLKQDNMDKLISFKINQSNYSGMWNGLR